MSEDFSLKNGPFEDNNQNVNGEDKNNNNYDNNHIRLRSYNNIDNYNIPII